MVGTGRFELPTPRTPSECSTRLSHVPTQSSRLTLEPAFGVVLSLHEGGACALAPGRIIFLEIIRCYPESQTTAQPQLTTDH